jgi:hypothetical protein
MSLNGFSASPTCVPGSGAYAPLSGIFPRAAAHRAFHGRERPRLIRVSDAMAGDAEGKVAGLRKPRPSLTAGRI